MAKTVEDRTLEVMGAWERMRARKRFYGLTLDEYKVRAKPFLDACAEIKALEEQLTHAVSRRDAAARALTDVTQGVVNSVKGDPAEGENGELYAAMGFIPKSQRATGLVRRRKAQRPEEVTGSGGRERPWALPRGRQGPRRT